MTQVQITDAEKKLVSTALNIYKEDLETAANAVLSAYLKRELNTGVDMVNRLIFRFQSQEAADVKIREWLRAGNKIEAIKYYRTVSGLGLKEAKDYVDSLQ